MNDDQQTGATLARDDFIYLAANDAMIPPLSGYDGILAHVPDGFEDWSHVQWRRDEWYTPAGELLSWVMSEACLLYKRELDQKYLHSLLKKTVLFLDPPAWRAMEQIYRAVDKTRETIYWPVDESARVYYYYCAWLLHVLYAYQDLCAKLAMANPQLRQHVTRPFRDFHVEDHPMLPKSDQQYGSFHDLCMLLIGSLHAELAYMQAELLYLAELEGIEVTEREANRLREDVETLGQELAEDWLATVYAAADQLQYEA